MQISIKQPETEREEHVSDVREVLNLGDVDDEALVTRILDGDRWAEEALYRKHARPLMAMAIRLLGNREEARDVVQDAFVVAFRDLKQLRDRRRVKSWMRQITLHQVHRRFRRRKLRRWLGLDDRDGHERLAFVPTSDASPELQAEMGHIEDILRQLPASERVSWVLRYVEGYSVMEVADACRCSHSTAKRRIAVSNARVRSELASNGALHG